MSQWRQDPLTGRWVIVAAGRGARPNEFALAERRTTDRDRCPFCPGHEAMTTPEIAAVGREPGAAADGPGWRLRVFPNLYPALRGDAESPPADGPFTAEPGRGAHEVIVTSADHAAGPATLGAEGLTDFLLLLRERVRALGLDRAHRYVLPFVNHGPEAGATLAHPHGQLVATPLVPDVVALKAARFLAHRRRTGRCLLCELLTAEEQAQTRMIAANEGAVVLAPWASRLPWEMLAMTRRHAPGLAAAADQDLRRLAEVLAEALAGLERIHADAPLNLVVHGAPLDREPGDRDTAAAFHWHLEILPRLTRLAGFEAGSGFNINALPPETAARRLRGEET